MQLIDELVTKPEKVILPNGMPKTVKLKLKVYKVENDEDAKDMNTMFSNNVQINCVIGKYIFTKELEEVKIAL